MKRTHQYFLLATIRSLNCDTMIDWLIDWLSMVPLFHQLSVKCSDMVSLDLHYFEIYICRKESVLLAVFCSDSSTYPYDLGGRLLLEYVVIAGHCPKGGLSSEDLKTIWLPVHVIKTKRWHGSECWWQLCHRINQMSWWCYNDDVALT